MAYLFRERDLLEEFATRNVVAESVGLVNQLDEIYFRCILDFGINGRLKRECNIKRSEDARETLNETYNYVRDLKEFQDMLVEVRKWVTNPKQDSFLKVLAQPNPLMFTGTVGVNKTTVSIFGEGLHDLQFTTDHRKDSKRQVIIKRIDALWTAIDWHIDDIKGVQLVAMAGGKNATFPDADNHGEDAE